jgi:hypothetical protein
MTQLAADSSYLQIYNNFIYPQGGLMALLDAPRLNDFGVKNATRLEQSQIVAAMIEYRLRSVQHASGTPRQANHNHALFFCSREKVVTARTIRAWWKKLHPTAIFLYLFHNGFESMLPQADDLDLSKQPNRHAADMNKMRKLLGAYAYIAETLEDPNLCSIEVPASIPRAVVQTEPFSDYESKIVESYAVDYLSMT